MTAKAKITDKKRLILLISAAAIGILLFAVGSLGVGKKTEAKQSAEMTYYTEELEARIASLLCSVAGIREAKVMLTLDGSSEYVYAQNEASTAKDYVIVSDGDGEGTVLVNEIFPKVRGVAVVCTGGDRADVQVKVTELLSAALGIGTNRIKVVGYGE